MRELSWKATQQGNTRCAPACGRGCTQAEYQHANQEAKKLCKLLGETTTGTWKPHVWENLGWHWAAHQDNWKVHPGFKNQWFTAYLGPNDTGGLWAENGRTPRSAIRNTRKVAMENVQAQATLLGMTLVAE